MSFMQSSRGGILSKKLELMDFLMERKPELLCLTETVNIRIYIKSVMTVDKKGTERMEEEVMW